MLNQSLDLNALLLDYSSSGDIAMVNRLITQGANIDATDKEGSTALICAARNGRTGVVRILIDKGVNVNAANKHGHTALNLCGNR